MNEWYDLIEKGGTIAVLVINLFLLTSGRLVPKSIVETMIKAMDASTTKLANEIREGIKDAVRDGIINGIHEVRNIKSG